MSIHPMSVNTNTIVRWDSMKNLVQSWNLTKKKVLDVGAGLGFFSMQFKNSGADVKAIDIDSEALDYLNQNYQIQTGTVDVEKEGYGDEKFDIVFIGEILEHVKDPYDSLKKCHDVLNSGGTLLISTPALEGLLIHTKGKALGHHEGPEKHERDGFFKHELEELLQKLDMEVTHHSYCLFFFSELFMQLTKLGYISSAKTYHSQHDIVSAMGSWKYKLLRTIFPVLNILFRLEQWLFNMLGFKGHCHIMAARKK